MKQLKLILTFALLLVLLTGCTGVATKTTGGGMYKSFDYGEHWEQKIMQAIMVKKI